MPLSFSIIINTYNQGITLGNTLRSLRYQRHPHFEVIVIHGSSTDGTQAVLAPYLPDIRLAHCTEKNIGASRNKGLAMAQGDIVCFIEGDILPEPDWLNELEAGYTDPDIAAVGGYILDHIGVQFASNVITSNRLGQDHHFKSIEAAEKSTLLKKAGDTKYHLRIPKNNASFRRSVLLEVGGFEEKQDFCLQETDISLRLIHAGYKICYRPEAQVQHIGMLAHSDNWANHPEQLHLLACSTAYLTLKHANLQNSTIKNKILIQRSKSKLKKTLTRAFLTSKLGFSAWRALLKEIHSGFKEGVKDAGYLNQKTPPTSLFQNHQESFKSFPVYRPAAERLHIGIVWQLYPPQKHTAGVVVWLHEVANGLAKLGHEVSVITHAKHKIQVDFEEGVWIYRTVQPTLRHRHLFYAFWRVPKKPAIPMSRKRIRYALHKTLNETMRVHARRKLDVICSPIVGFEGLPFIADGKIPTVISMHSCERFSAESKPEKDRERFYKRKKAQALLRAEEWTFLHATHLLANTNAIIQDTERLYGIKIAPDRVTIIPHGMKDLSVYAKNNTASSAVQSASKKDHPIRITSVGRLEDRKGTDLLLETLPDLLTRYPNVEMYFIGNHLVQCDGINYRERFLKQYAQAPWLHRVHFEGSVSDSALYTFYEQTDIFVAPSRYESFGLMYVEAMTFGKPCIGTEVGGIPEVVKHNETGLLVPINDAQKLSEALARLIEDAPLRRQLGQQGRARYESEFTETLMAKRIAALLQKVSDEAKRTCELTT